jgi:hypothetical protein
MPNGHPRSFMTNNLDALLTALYVHLDDHVLPALGWSRDHRAGGKPALSDAELACLAAAWHLLGIASERRWIRYARKNLAGMFPGLPGQSGYGRRLRRQGGLLAAVITGRPRPGSFRRVLEGELAFEGVEDGLDPLSLPGELPEPGGLVLAVGPDQVRARLAGDEGLEVPAGEALVPEDDLAGADQVVVAFQQGPG